MRIAFVGLGIMGKHMVRNFIPAGHELVRDGATRKVLRQARRLSI